jgi:hypothetical protein
MIYYDVKKYWTKRIQPHFDDPELNSRLFRDFRKYCTWHFRPGDLPAWSDGCDWRCEVLGRPPCYFDYVCAGACHWLVNFNLRLAELSVTVHGPRATSV